jgi:hypothetical protein
MSMFGLSSHVHFAHTACYWKVFFCTTRRSSVSSGFTEQIMPILRILCYNGSLVTWTVVRLTTAKFIPLIFFMSDFNLSYTANMFILMILYDFCLSLAQFCYIIVYIRKVEICVQIADSVCTLANLQWCTEPCSACVAILRGRCLLLIPRRELLRLKKSKLCYDRRSAGQSVLEQSTHLGLTTRSWLLSDSCGFADLGRPLWREDGSVVCNCYWSSPVQFGSWVELSWVLC